MTKVKLHINKLCYNGIQLTYKDDRKTRWNGEVFTNWYYYKDRLFTWRPNIVYPFEIIDVKINGKWHPLPKEYVSFIVGKEK